VRPRKRKALTPLGSNVAWTVAGNGVHAATRWLGISVMTKLVSPEQVGIYGLAAAVVLPIFTVLGMNVRALQATDARTDFRFQDYGAARSIMAAAALGLCALLGAIAYSGQVFAMVLATAASQLVESGSDVTLGLLQKRERHRTIALALAWRGIARLIAFCTTLWLTRDLVLALGAEATAAALVLFGYEIPSCGRLLKGSGDGVLTPEWNGPAQRRLVRLGLPMMGMLLLASVQTYMPRHVIERFVGAHELGIFVALSTLASVPGPLLTALGLVASPRLALYFVQDRRSEFHRLLTVVVGSAAIAGLLGILAAAFVGRPVLAWLFTPDYADQRLLVWLMSAATLAFLANALGTVVTATRAYRAAFLVQLLTTIVTLPAYFVLTMRWGTSGTIAASALQAGFAAIGFVITLLGVKLGDARVPTSSD
jgi:O-antigen/teichoic acid export membrane protein